MAGNRVTSLLRIQLCIVVVHDDEVDVKEVVDNLSIQMQGSQDHGNANFIGAKTLGYEKINKKGK